MKCNFPNCKKKVELIHQSKSCKCSMYFCNQHRLPENHSCNYYYNENGSRKIIQCKVEEEQLKLVQLIKI